MWIDITKISYINTFQFMPYHPDVNSLKRMQCTVLNIKAQAIILPIVKWLHARGWRSYLV
jgi:hypothetical protein